ncbi:MAG TPA: YetF domain-containing protein [Acidimicrobiales bacterium]|nr:YetF domain-containing protein [Acidimicrobiales bacterium]
MEIVARASVAFIFVFVLLRGMKRKTLSDLSPLELILLVVLGDLVQTGVTQEDYSVSGLFLSVSTFAFWVTVMNWLTWRSERARRMIEGVPLVVIDDGKPVEATLKLEQIPMAELYEAARQEGIEDLRDVRLGVLEVSGRISFIKRDQAS